MSKSKSISNRLREVLVDGRWIANTNIKEQIESVTWEQANDKIGDHNSIAQLTFHINYFLSGILNVLKGGDLEIRDKYSFAMAPIRSEEEWLNLVEDYLSNAYEFIEHVEMMKDEKLDEIFVKELYGTYERNIEGQIEHGYYHLGQIVLIKKLLQFDVRK